ncbi:hypothetical protein HDV05_007149, partial [Chytridiales sp. JEL 0842]
MSGLKHHNLFPHPTKLSHVVVDNDYAHVSGQLAVDPAIGQIAPGPADQETARCMDQMKACLNSVGLDLRDLVRVHIYITDLADLETINTV